MQQTCFDNTLRLPPHHRRGNHFLESREMAVMPNGGIPLIGHSIARFEGRYTILSGR